VSSIAVIGTGYVGLTTGACLAHLGHSVVCVDIDVARIAGLESGVVPFLEDGLQGLVQDGVRTGRLRFTTTAAAAVPDAEFVYLCVPTPQGPDGAADLTFVERAAREIAPHLETGAIVVTKSTVPVGSTRVVERALARPDVSVVSNPEFLREGTAVHDFLHPDRIVIGADHSSVGGRLAAVYTKISAPTLVTDPASAETIKYAANAFLAMKVSFANEVAALCESAGADVGDVVLGIGYDKRIGHEFLRPGPGWGGSCFPKDTRALVRMFDDAGLESPLVAAAVAANEQHMDRVATKIAVAAGRPIGEARVAVWGLTFKARTDDLRDSPALAIAGRLSSRGASVTAFDPTVDGLDGPEIDIVTDPYAAAAGADVLAVLTEWEEFRWLDLPKVVRSMRHPSIVDARNVLDRATVKRAGASYQGIGLS
jgi:UDPglucose 6-dehydrogenase